MAGYGNRTAPTSLPSSLTDAHESTRLGLHTSRDAYSDAHPKYGSGATGGAGFGTIFLLTHYPISTSTSSSYQPLISSPTTRNKRMQDYQLTHQGNKSDLPSASPSNDEFRFGLHADTAPYSGASESRAGSGSTGGAGYGNKTGGFAHSGDSTLGKVMEKAGHVMHNEGLVAKGAAKRQEAVAEGEAREKPPFAN
ncbi:hypothetical protein HBI56_175390 [Parastagonospora nodorum]|uniref:Uncharacterized protein n=2 Tax=Phaeosphaeria nodorum (strain SN15 / ATCC MYA-4574 / FGSC 10173) TaxID=321614 RepID=A0A7U2I807_PHANO|nr:hypothetical protein SNOG_13796 [Parastagonospora nodorum SN15]KAH3912040.1 hypothetical protein HBH56_120850 [Parastagonospora nodorum]EAT78820.1 hypothetical protein SNOG_13796 [Parastagonospora nodorum SN15]KAH3924274.1 hypothetical protein HBH54_196750 [Parastagonospora nodorum]KAH3942546.1 hypothetical protein HBH53_186750 [Parastagonospora nodorum]KAH3968540.1 hypothetical protein HBH52_179210 [Parastagonospora nodorum]